jgi:fructose-1,6-bisphosphatase/inositol monophosphatase family enzyme
MATWERLVAIESARAAGRLLHRELRAAHRIAFKGTSANLVTEMDVRAEERLGVAYNPSFDELYVAERGRGASVNGVRLAVSTTATLDESLLTTGFPYGIRESRDTNLPEYATFAVRCRGVRRLGSAVLDLAWVATERLDGFWELRLGSWDVAAGSLFVEEAGGRVTNLVLAVLRQIRNV